MVPFDFKFDMIFADLLISFPMVESVVRQERLCAWTKGSGTRAAAGMTSWSSIGDGSAFAVRN